MIKDLDPATGIYGLTELETECYGNGDDYYFEEVKYGQTILSLLEFDAHYEYVGSQYDVDNNKFNHIDNHVTTQVTQYRGPTDVPPPQQVSNKLIHAAGFNPGTGMRAMPTFGISGNVPLPALVDVVMSDSGTSFGAIDFSELEITLPEINNVYPPPPPVPMGDVTVPSETILGMFMEVAQGAMSGLKAGAGEVAYKGSLPFAWMSGKTEFETLRDYRDQAWIDSGLDGTKTQYYTQVSANIGVGAGYGAAGLAGIRALVSKIPVKQPSLPSNRADLHISLRSRGLEYKGTSQGRYVTYKHPDGTTVTVKPTGEVIPTRPKISLDGKKYSERLDYNFNRLPDQSHSTGHFVESLQINHNIRPN